VTRRALVTGSAGFVGRHVARELRARGWEVQGWEVQGWDLQAGIGWQGDVRDVLRRDTGRRLDLVVHAAAHVGGRVDIEGRPTFLGAYNLQLDGALFEWALRARPARVVYLSSSAVYPVRLQGAGAGRLAEPDVDLGRPELPDATYGWTKLTGERLAAEARAEGVAVTVVRPFSGYGADQSADYPFRALVERALRRDDPFRVWGTGEQVRDWVHIDDVVGGVMAAVEQGVDGPVNLCTGRGVSFFELAGLVTRQAGYRPVVEPVPGAPAGVLHRVGDPTRMLGFFAPVVDLEAGVRRAFAEPRAPVLGV